MQIYRWQANLNHIIRWCEDMNTIRFTHKDVGLLARDLQSLRNKGWLRKVGHTQMRKRNVYVLTDKVNVQVNDDSSKNR